MLECFRLGLLLFEILCKIYFDISMFRYYQSCPRIKQKIHL